MSKYNAVKRGIDPETGREVFYGFSDEITIWTDEDGVVWVFPNEVLDNYGADYDSSNA